MAVLPRATDSYYGHPPQPGNQIHVPKGQRRSHYIRLNINGKDIFRKYVQAAFCLHPMTYTAKSTESPGWSKAGKGSTDLKKDTLKKLLSVVIVKVEKLDGKNRSIHPDNHSVDPELRRMVIVFIK